MRIFLAVTLLALSGIASGLESALPAAQQQPAPRQSLLSDMRSAIASGQPATARAHAARLLDLGHPKEAVNWLAALDDASPLKLRLRLHAGLVKPDAAIARARARAAKGGGAEWWRVLADAAEKGGDGTLAVEAQEQLLDAGEPAAELWQAYDREARAAANQHKLLAGDDAAWLELARRPAVRPARSRALLAYLSRHAADRETRLRAQVRHVHSLQQGSLERAAVQVYERYLKNG